MKGRDFRVAIQNRFLEEKPPLYQEVQTLHFLASPCRMTPNLSRLQA
jgi:hypothetical protein